MKKIVSILTHILLIISIIFLILSIAIECTKRGQTLQSMIHEYKDEKGYQLVVNDSVVEDVTYLPMLLTGYSIVIDDSKDTLFINTER